MIEDGQEDEREDDGWCASQQSDIRKPIVILKTKPIVISWYVKAIGKLNGMSTDRCNYVILMATGLYSSIQILSLARFVSCAFINSKILWCNLNLNKFRYKKNKT